MKRYTIFLAVLMTSCTTPYDKGLKGVWQYVSGNYISENSTTNMTSDNVKSIKIYGDNHYSLVTQIVSSDIFLPIVDYIIWMVIHIQNRLKFTKISR